MICSVILNRCIVIVVASLAQFSSKNLAIKTIKAMKFLIILVLVCILSVVNAASVNLTHVTLKQELGAHKTMIVMYYAPWCSHSRETLPIWENLSELMAQVNNMIFCNYNVCCNFPLTSFSEFTRQGHIHCEG